MKKVLPILLCLLALAVPRLYGQDRTVTFSAQPAEGGTVEASYLISYDDPPVSLGSGEKVKNDELVNFTVTPKEGYEVEKWEFNGTVDELANGKKECSKTIDADMTVVVYLKQKAGQTATHTVTVSAEPASEKNYVQIKDDNTYANIASGSAVADGTVINIYAYCDKKKYKFDYWEVDGVRSEEFKTDKIRGYAVTKDVTFKAYFRELEMLPITFSVNGPGTIDAKSYGVVTKSGDKIIENAYVVFVAIPENENAEIRDWTINGATDKAGKTKVSYKMDPGKENTVVANFVWRVAPTKVKLTYSAATAGGKLTALVTPAAGGDPYQGNSGDSVDYKAMVSFQAEADPGYAVEKWVVDGAENTAAGTDNMLMLTLEKSTDVQVYFKKDEGTTDTYSVTYAADPVDGGTVTATYAEGFSDVDIVSGTNVPAGKNVTFKAEAYAGYEFEKFTVNGLDAPVDFTAPEKYATELTGNLNVVAHFKSTAPAEKYAVTFAAEPAGYGELTATRYDDGTEAEVAFTSGAEFAAGAFLTFNATPGADYKVEKWLVNGNAIEMPSNPKEYTHELDAPLDVKVVFTTKPNEVTLKYSVAAEPAEAGQIAVAVTPKGGGAATSPASGSKVARGSSVTFTATPAAGYEVEKWLVNGKPNSEAGQKTKLTMTLDDDTEVQLFFKKEAAKYVVNFTADPVKGGTITASGYVNSQYKTITSGEALPEGSYIDFEATANEGYEFVKWTVNGADGTPDFANPNKLSQAITGETNIVAHFKSVDTKITITYSAGANGKFTTVKLQKEGQDDVDVKSGDEVDRGSYIVFNVMPDKGYIVDKWSVNGEEVHSREVNSYDGTFDETSEVKVTFRKPKLTIAAAEGGKIVASVNGTEVPDVADVALGANVSIEATPNPGYELTALTANDKDILVAKSFAMKGDTKVVATFTKKANVANYKVTLKSNEHGTISIKEQVDLNAVPEGTKLTVVAKGANDKCELTKLTANGVDILKDKTFTVAKDTEVIAEFVDHTGIDAVAADAFVIYPNPASESATITGLAPEAAVALYTLDGQLITRLAADRSGRLQIDLTALSEGTYLVVTEGAAQRLVVKH